MDEGKQHTSALDEPDRYFEEALSIANRNDLDYLTRFGMLDTWWARISEKKP